MMIISCRIAAAGALIVAMVCGGCVVAVDLGSDHSKSTRATHSPASLSSQEVKPAALGYGAKSQAGDKPAASEKPGLSDKPASSEKPASAPAPGDRAALEQQLEKTLTGVVMVGSFTVNVKAKEPLPDPGAKPAASPKTERYAISSAKKIKDDLWLIGARMQWGSKDVTMPVPVYIQWAGDTPVITLTDMTIPGLGVFTARVLIYRGQYAGTWQHGEVKGQMFGKLERAEEKGATGVGKNTGNAGNADQKVDPSTSK